MPTNDSMLDAALDAIRRGYQPIPIRPTLKKPLFGGWQHVTWDPTTTREQWLARIKDWGFESDDPYNLGIVLGPVSNNLVDIDIDHPRAKRFRDLLPRTQARSGRPGSPDSHFWYEVTGDDIPSTRRYTLADNATVTIEFRYDRGVQTVIPPSDWVPKNWEMTLAEGGFASNPAYIEIRNWSREPFGGAAGPAKVDGRRLAVQVALIGLGTVLLDNWPKSGGRHDAYLALAGALMRLGDTLHPFWGANGGANAATLIRALADAAQDDDGPDAREHESIPSTIKGILDGKPVWGFPKLAEIIGSDQVTKVISMVAEVESLAGFVSRQASATPAPLAAGTPLAPTTPGTPATAPTAAPSPGDDGEPLDPIPEEPLVGTWSSIDLDPYLNGQFKPVAPTVLVRADGNALFYPGRLNMLFAPSESGKTLLALYTAIEQMTAGERVVFVDLEDEPVNTIERLRSMGVSDDELRLQFTYVRPDEPIAGMQRDHWGSHKSTPVGEANAAIFAKMLESVDPALIIVDGMTSIYGLHGLDSNNSVETDVITTWLKGLARNGRTTVIIIDHMAKAAEKGSMPIGSQHKVSMVQGTLLQVWPTKQPILGAIGTLELIVLKDRPGQVRKNAGPVNGKAQVAAVVTVDSTVNGGQSTQFTIGNPPPNASGNAASGASVSVNLTSSKLKATAAVRKNAQQEAMEKAFLTPFKNTVGTTLSGKQISSAITPLWKAAGWSETSAVVTRDRLIMQGRLFKTGGERGPNVAYELTPTGVDDGTN